MTNNAASLADLGGNGFRALTELAPDFIAVLNRNGVIEYASPSVERVMGYRPAEVIGRPFLELIYPQDQRAAQEIIAESPANGGDIAPATLRYKHADGSLRTLETLAKNCTGTLGECGLLVSTRDITRRVAEEKALRGAIAIADDLYNSAPCGYQSLDEYGVFVRINDTELRWLGRAREEVLGNMRFPDLLTPRSRPSFERQFRLFWASGRVEDLEFELVRKDGSAFFVLLSAIAIADEHGRLVRSRSTLHDITERKDAESSLRRMNRALQFRSAAHSELIHAKDEPGLLEAICRVSVELGGYRMAWVGFAVHDETKSVRAAAQSGFDDGYLERANITWAECARGLGPTGTAIRSGVPQVIQQFLTNPLVGPWRDDAVRCGYQSSIALPLKKSSITFGALMIYAAQSNAFDSEELRMLSEMADDLAFGIVMFREREQHRRVEEKVAYLAYFDPLTGLSNRSRLMEVLAQAAAELGSGKPGLALLTLKVARFDEIQTGIGVRRADDLLRELATRLLGALRDGELLARLSSDSFAVVLRGSDAIHARDYGPRFEHTLIQPFRQAGVPITVHLHIGAAVAPEHGLDPEVLVLRSGIAARHAEKSGTAFALYDGPNESESPRYLALISDLRAAIEAKQLVLHYQPKLDLRSGRVCGAEALVRWQHPKRGLIMPCEFIGLAEQTELIRPLTYHVLDAALQQCNLWRGQGFDLPVAVNISANSLNDPDFLNRIEEALKKWDLRPELLQLEITESALIAEPAKAHDLLVRLKDRRILVSLDDFGTGYSSLGYVASLPFDALKIDRSFVSRMLDSPRTNSVVAATISLAHSLAIKTVAEGVETKDQVVALVVMGCTEVQGYFFCRPVEAEKLRHWAADFSLDFYGIQPASGQGPEAKSAL